MNHADPGSEPREAEPCGERAAAAPREPSLAESLGELWDRVQALVEQALELVALEARMAAVSLAGIVALGVVVGIGLMSTWFLVVAAAAVWLTERTGLGWTGALLLMVLLNLVLTALAWLAIQTLSANLQFRRTRRQLTHKPERDANASHPPSEA